MVDKFLKLSCLGIIFCFISCSSVPKSFDPNEAILNYDRLTVSQVLKRYDKSGDDLIFFQEPPCVVGLLFLNFPKKENPYLLMVLKGGNVVRNNCSPSYKDFLNAVPESFQFISEYDYNMIL